MTGTRRSIAKRVAVDADITELDANKTLDAILNSVAGFLGTNGRVELRDFGVFTTRHKEPRTRRNPRTGEAVEVPAKTVVFFTPGVNVKQAVAQSKAVNNGG